jgi:hypothetical protein
MKVYWEYMCDYGHAWTLFREETAEEQVEDAICPYGHEAVTLRKETPLDLVEITLRPAARVVDKVTNQTSLERHYWIMLTNIEGTERKISKEPILTQEVRGLVERFFGRSQAEAWKLWDELQL